MGHPFGDLISQHLHRKHGLSQSKLAEGILQAPTVITGMCHGRRLTGPQARERVVTIIGWLRAQGALATQDEAEALLAAAGMLPLKTSHPVEAEVLQALAPTSRNGIGVAHEGIDHLRAELRPAPRRNLPAQLTRFIGREGQVKQLVELVQATRLLTLTGSGGVGKTRLALEVGAQVMDHFADGVWLVDFAPLADPALIAQTVAQLFHLPERPGYTYLHTVLTYLETKRALLIFDNCEHLIDACAGLAEELLRGCPEVHLFVTSREVLRVEGETTWRVPSLTRPPLDNNRVSANPASLSHTDELLGYESVRLFLARTQEAQAGSAYPTTHLAAIAQICSQLDGIPLAVEMAAARMSAMTAEEIAAQLSEALGERFRLLTSGARTAPLRQRTLLATLEWSYALLLPAEQHLLARLAVFAGGWTAAAAKTVCADVEQGDLPAPAVLPALLALVQKSLVIAEQRNSQTRYRMLETVRQYAAEKLAAHGEESALHDRHLHYYLALAEQPPLERLAGLRLAAKLKELEAESNNLRAALAWTRADADGGELRLRLAGALWGFWYERGYHNEGRAWLEEALESTFPSPEALRARAASGLAYMTWGVDTRRMAELAEKSLVLSQKADYPFGIICSLTLLGEVAWKRQDYARAQTLFEQATRISVVAGTTNLWGSPGLMLARLLLQRGEQTQAATHFEAGVESARVTEDHRILYYALDGLSAIDPRQALVLCEQELARTSAGIDPEIQATLLHLYGRLLLDAGDASRAAVVLESAVAIQRALSIDWNEIGGSGLALCDLGRAFWLKGNLERALTCYQASLQVYKEVDDNRTTAIVLSYCGYAALEQRDLARAIEFFRRGFELWRDAGEPAYAPMILAGAAEVMQMQGNVQQSARLYGAAAQFAPLLRARSPSERIGYERLMAEARLHLDDPAFAAPWAEGETLTIEEAVALALSTGEAPVIDIPTGASPV